MTSNPPPAVERTIPPAALTKVLNPAMRLVLRSPLHRLVDDGVMLLHYTGRRSGRAFTVPVAHHEVDGALLSLTSSGWKANFRGGGDAELTLRGCRRPVHALLSEDPDDVARVYAGRIAEVGLEGAGRRLGIRINVDRAPTHDELADAARRAGLSVLRYTFPAAAPR